MQFLFGRSQRQDVSTSTIDNPSQLNEKKIAFPDDVREIMKPFLLTDSQLKHVMKHLDNDMNRGLDPSTSDKASLKMIPSPITKLPTGNEIGEYIALDVGGAVYRILLMTLVGNNLPPSVKQTFNVIPEIKVKGTLEELFDFIVKEIDTFLKFNKFPKRSIALGLSFGFPCIQTNIKELKVSKWTKNFNFNLKPDTNIVDLLAASLEGNGLGNIHCEVVINDTLGTLAAAHIANKDTAIGVIADNGCNASYAEDINKVKSIDRNKYPDTNVIFINTEWGAFGENGVLKNIYTKYDKILDKQSFHAGKQLFEKMISGLFLGELCRLVMLELVQKKLLFQGKLPDSLRKKDSFSTKNMMTCERDPPNLFYSTEFLFYNEFHIANFNRIDAVIVRNICETISNRATLLIGCAIASLINRLQRPMTVVGLDGFMFRHYPQFAERTEACIECYVKPDYKFKLSLTVDGSSLGAASVAAAYDIHNNNK